MLYANARQMQTVRWILAKIVPLAIDYRYKGIILCEGDGNSIDVSLYSAIYPSYYIVPVGGCTDVVPIQRSLKKRCNKLPVYGIIDRDSLSKKCIRKYQKEGIFCTKLPFIENIISSPEVVQIICEEHQIVRDKTYGDVSEALMRLLCRKIVYALPINIDIEDEKEVSSVTIKYEKKDGTIIEKQVDASNVLYVYRDKAVANETARILGISGKRKYYEFFKKCLNDPKICPRILKSVSKYTPEIPD